MSKGTVEKQKKEAREIEEVSDHLIKIIEENDKRFSFEFGSVGTGLGKIAIYDKEKDVEYILKIEKIQYDENDNPVNI